MAGLRADRGVTSVAVLAAIVLAYLRPILKRSSSSTSRALLPLALAVTACALLLGATGHLYFLGGESPANVRAPTLSGVPRVGVTLIGRAGRWRPSRGLGL